ncbi:MAG: Tab2/Atab2 family RNA-binding protein [Cyanobacteria bacterium P01_A01_bin.135]
MITWQTDFYRRPLQQDGQPVWELVICCPEAEFLVHAFCRQSDANSAWLTAQLETILQHHHRPDEIQVFRPQSLSLLVAAAQPLDISVAATRRTRLLKAHLQDRIGVYQSMEGYTGEAYQPSAVESLPPVPLPEHLQGEQWRFGAIAAGDLMTFIEETPIPIRSAPAALHPLSLKLPSDLPIPGVVIDAGRQSMRLAQWLQEQDPVCLSYIPGAPDGLILEAGLSDRWVMATFEDEVVSQAGQTFQRRCQRSRGLHFLLVQPDDSGVTYSGLWLQQPA